MKPQQELLQLTCLLLVGLVAHLLSKTVLGWFPASVLGMVLLFVLLKFGVLKEQHVSGVADFLLRNMSFLFIPAAVDIINHYGALKNNLIALVAITVITTLLTFVVAGFTTSYLMQVGQKNKRHFYAS
jgi:holin-like protein